MGGSSSSTPVTAVVVTYQSEQTISEMLAEARRCHDQGLLDLVIVDNNSTDGTRQVIEREASWAQHHFTGVNNGFARGCNIGLAQVRTPYTILINPDAILTPEALRTLLGFMESHPRAGIVGPAIVQGNIDEPQGLQESGLRPTPWLIVRNALPFERLFRPLAWPIVPGTAPVRTEWVCGAVLMIRTDLMRRLGGFDPRFFLYWEETDLCRRAEDLGFETWAVGSASARHLGGVSSAGDDRRIDGCVATHFYRSRYYYLTKHHGVIAAFTAEIGEFLLLALRTMIDLLFGRGARRILPRLQAPLFSKPAEWSAQGSTDPMNPVG
jgi:N-acetylglucosaminyl-diphospho-decaprenol L-rhamnosyltransferase